MVIKHSMESDWNLWKKSLCDAFANKGWSPLRYAYPFKYSTGTLLEYAIKKEKQLLEIRKDIDKGTLIDLIELGLPNYVANMIDRETLKEAEDVFNEIGKLEHMIYRKPINNKDKHFNNKGKFEKKPCSVCKEKNKGLRYHEEDKWFKAESQSKISTGNVTL